MQLYDYLLTLPVEVRLDIIEYNDRNTLMLYQVKWIWKWEWGVGKVLYLLTRYIPAVCLTGYIVRKSRPSYRLP